MSGPVITNEDITNATTVDLNNRDGGESYETNDLGGGLFQNRGAGPENYNGMSVAQIGTVVLAGAQHAWNAQAANIMMGLSSIEDIPEHLRPMVQERIDNPAPSVERSVSEYKEWENNAKPGETWDDYKAQEPDATKSQATNTKGTSSLPANTGLKPGNRGNGGGIFGAVGDFLGLSIQEIMGRISESQGEGGILAPNETGAVNVSTGAAADPSEIGNAGGEVVAVPVIGEDAGGGGGGGGGGGSSDDGGGGGASAVSDPLIDNVGDVTRPAAEGAGMGGGTIGAGETVSGAAIEDPDAGNQSGTAENVTEDDDGIDINFGIDLREVNEDDVTVPTNTTVDREVTTDVLTGEESFPGAGVDGEELEGELEGESDPGTVGDGEAEGEGLAGAGEGTGEGEGEGGGTGTGDGTGSGEGTGAGAGTGDGAGEGGGSGSGDGTGTGDGSGDGTGMEAQEQNPLTLPEVTDIEPSDPTRKTIPGYFGWSKGAVEDQHKRNPWTYRR